MRCPHCGKESDPLFRFCLHCGRELAGKKKESTEPKVSAVKASVAPAPAPAPAPVPVAVERHETAALQSQMARAKTQIPVNLAETEKREQIRLEEHPVSARPPTEEVTSNVGDRELTPPPEEEIPEPEPVKADEFQRCPRCRAKVEDKAVKCALCGYVLRPDAWNQAQESAKPAGVRVGTKAYLVSIDTSSGKEVKRIPLLEGVLSLGRRNCDICFEEDELLSPLHLNIQVKPGEVLLKCTGALNGTYLRIEDQLALEHGDTFRMGQQILRFEEMRFIEPMVRPADDGTRVMGSPTTSLAWGRLVQVIGKSINGSIFLLKGDEVQIGREKGVITFPGDRYMSGKHGLVMRRVDGYFLKDLGSSNGTYVRLKGVQPVKPGQYVLAGKQLLRFEM